MGSTPRGISASRAAAILGLGEYEGQTVFTVWQLICEERKPGFNKDRGYLLPEPPDNAAIRFGTAFEDAIVELASAKQGKTIGMREQSFSVGPSGESYDIDDGRDYTDEELYITCHIDGLYSAENMIGPVGWTLHEGKTTNLWTFRELWGEPGTDRVPSGYQCQAQHQTLCTGAQEDIVSVLVFPRRPDEWEKEGYTLVLDETGVWHMDTEKSINAAHPSDWARVIAEMGLFHQYPVAAKAELQAEMVERYRHFWATYVLPEVEPPIDAYSDMLRAFPAPVGTIVVTEQEAAWLVERKMITEEISDTSPMARRKKALATLTLDSIRSRIGQAVMDEESQDKVVFVDSQGKKLGSYNGKVFR